MKIIFGMFLFCCCSGAFAQQQTVIIYSGNGQIIGGNYIKSMPPKQLILTDTSSNNKYVLDTVHRSVTAYNAKGDTLWHTNPWKDRTMNYYRIKDPIIVDMAFGTNEGFVDPQRKAERVIWIRYFTTQFGYIELKTGRFILCGQD